jgi:hypothetical protein
MVKRGSVAFLLLILCLGLLMFLADHAGGSTFLHEVLRMQVFGRLESASLPRYFYFTDSFGSYALAYPVAILVLSGLVFRWVKTRDITTEMRFMLLLASWMAIILFGMSVPADKKVRYVLPMLPACALIAASFYTMQEQWLVWFKKILLMIFLILPALFFAAVWWIQYTNELKSLSLPVHFILCLVIFALTQILQVVVLVKTSKQDFSMHMLGIAAASFVIFYLGVKEPIQLHIDRARDTVQEIERLRMRDHAKLVFYREGRDSLPIKYIINMPEADQAEFVYSLDELRSRKDSVYVVTSTSYADDIAIGLPKEYQQIMTAKLAHVDIVVYTRRKP